MRKLASIQKVTATHPIEGRDRIVLADVLGWHVIVRKEDIHAGDLVVYCETDSILPTTIPGFEDKSAGKRHIRMMKMAGVYSQGICFPLSILPKGEYHEGDDVTEKLGVKKYEPDERNGKAKWYHHGNSCRPPKKWWARFRLGRWLWRKFIYKQAYGKFPTAIVPKTDETRVQVLQDVLQKHKGVMMQATEKIDGSSITFWLDCRKKLHVSSRNREIYTHEDFMYQAAEKLKDRLMDGYVYQGEIIGPNIQGNKYDVKDYRIYAYNMWSESGHCYVDPSELKTLCGHTGIVTVPYLEQFPLTDDIDELVEKSKGSSRLNPGTLREGIVIRPLENIQVHDERFVGGRLSFKAINPDFALKHKL